MALIKVGTSDANSFFAPFGGVVTIPIDGLAAPPAVTPVADFSANSVSVVEGETVTFTDLSTNNPTSWSWTFTTTNTVTYVNGTSSSSQNPQVHFTGTDNVDVQLQASNSAGSDTETKLNYISVSAGGSGPIASFTISDSTPDVNQTVTLTDTSSNSPTGVSWSISPTSYDIESGTLTSSPLVVNFNNATTNYTVNITATNAVDSDSTSFTNNITTNSAPVASFTISDSTPDTGQTVTFTDASSNTPTTWSWAISGGAFAYVGGTSSSSQNPQVSFSATSTNYTVNLTATNANGSDSTVFSNNITTNAAGVSAPVASFTISDSTPDTGQTVTFTDTSTNTPTTWSWSISGGGFAYVGGTSSSSQNPQVSFSATSTNYTVNLTATNAGGSDSTSFTNNITTNIAQTSKLFEIDFVNTSSYVGSGSTLNDLSPEGNSMTLNSGYSFSSDNPKSMTFSTGYAEVTSTTSDFEFQTNESFGVFVTFEVPPTSDGVATLISNMLSSSPFGGWDILLLPSTELIYFQFIDSWTSDAMEVQWSYDFGSNAGKFIQIGVVFDGSSPTNAAGNLASVDLYIDGALYTTGKSDGGYTLSNSSITYNSSVELRLSSRWASGASSTGFNRAITHAVIYNGIPSVTEIENQYDDIKTRFKPNASFTISNSTPDTGATVTFTDTSTSPKGSITNYSWSISGGAFAYVGGTSSTSQNPQVSFSATSTNYTVNLTATNANGSDSTSFSNNITTNAATGEPTGIVSGSSLNIDFGDSSCYSGGTSVVNQGSISLTGTIVGSNYIHTSGTTGFMSVTGGTTYIEWPINSTLQSLHTDDFTHYFVVKDVSVAGAILHNGNPTAFNDPSGTPEQYVWALHYNNNGSLGSSVEASAQTYSTNWTHIAVTISNGVYKWYKNGTLIETDTVSNFSFITYAQKWLTWRRPRDTTSLYFTGKHSILLVYDSVLTDSEIQDNFDYLKTRYPIT